MEQGHEIGREERPDDVPQQEVKGDFPVERASINWIENALNHRGFVLVESPSRENSLATTKLEEALMWAEKDLEQKQAAKAAAEAPDEDEVSEEDAPRG